MRHARPRTQGRPRLAVAALAALAALGLSSRPAASAAPWQEYVIWSFCSGSNCSDGLNPEGGVFMDPDGNLWGTTLYGGRGAGTVYELTMPSTKVVQFVLHSFCSTLAKNLACSDGALPSAGLVEGYLGYFFGVTYDGGAGGPRGTNGGGGGTVFEVLPGGQFKTLHEFCKRGTPCFGGASPAYGLVANEEGTVFYGTTVNGGRQDDAGTVFRVASGGRVRTLYRFCSLANCKDGRTPSGPLIRDGAGNLYGTTSVGGANGQGTVFKLTPSGTEKVLYSFCPAAGCADGQQPAGKLATDSSGNLYGTASAGGANGGGPNGAGVVFKVDPSGNETVLYSFCSGGAPCTDGSSPSAGVVMNLSGSTLYGTTAAGGATDQGTVFEVPIVGGSETMLYSFCGTNEPVCADGSTPSGPLLVDGEGNILGTTVWGGGQNTTNQVTGGGTVFELINPSPGT